MALGSAGDERRRLASYSCLDVRLGELGFEPLVEALRVLRLRLRPLVHPRNGLLPPPESAPASSYILVSQVRVNGARTGHYCRHGHRELMFLEMMEEQS